MKNVILLSVDALRADHLSCYGYQRETSPFLDEFADSNVFFEYPYSASSNTREAVPALITGQYPDTAIGSDYKLDTQTIASTLSKEGYSTAAFHSNPYASRAFGTDDGFDTYDDDLHFGKNKLIALAQRALDKIRNKHYVRADGINERSLKWIDNREEDDPFFLWNHYMDVHGPYEPPSEFRELFEDRSISDRKAQRLYLRAVRDPQSVTDSEQEFLINLYDGEIRYIDSQIESFLAKLEERDLLENSLIIITSDHGDAFGEHGYYEHPRHLHEELTYVPLLLKSPEIDRARYSNTLVSMLDIAPTIIDCAGISVDCPGESLFSLLSDPPEERAVFSQARGEKSESHIFRFAARTVNSRAMAEWNSNTKEIDIIERGSNRVTSKLRRHVSKRVTGINGDKSPVEVNSEEMERRLSALGYKK
jgi:arylsulfatase